MNDDTISRKDLMEVIKSLEISISGMSPKISKIVGDAWRESVLRIIDESPSVND